MGWYGLTLGIAPAISPIIAGIFADTIGWRGIFVFLAIPLIIAFIFAAATFDDVLETQDIKFDPLSFVLSALAFCGLTLGIGNIATYGITSPHAGLLIIIGMVSCVLFIYRQLHQRDPFLDIRAFGNRDFAVGVIGSMILYFVMMGFTMLLPIYLQTICNHSATVSGIVKLPGSIVMSVVSLFAGKLYDRFGIRKIFISGAVILLISNINLTLMSATTSLWMVGLTNIIYGIAVGCLLMPLVTWAVNGLSSNMTAHGTAFANSLRTVAGSIGTAVFIGVMSIVSESVMNKYGADAQQYGYKIACIAMVICTILLLLIAMIFTTHHSHTLRARVPKT